MQAHSRCRGSSNLYMKGHIQRKFVARYKCVCGGGGEGKDTRQPASAESGRTGGQGSCLPRPPCAPHSRPLPGDPGLAPRGRVHVDRSTGDPTFLHTARSSRDRPAARIGAHSPGGIQNTRELLQLQVQPWSFQFARDREAPPSGHDVH